jgi:hypothetical protein
MPFQGRETPVQVVEVAGAAPDVGALPRDEFAQFLGDSFTVTSRTEGGQLARPIEGIYGSSVRRPTRSRSRSTSAEAYCR